MNNEEISQAIGLDVRALYIRCSQEHGDLIWAIREILIKDTQWLDEEHTARLLTLLTKLIDPRIRGTRLVCDLFKSGLIKLGIPQLDLLLSQNLARCPQVRK